MNIPLIIVILYVAFLLGLGIFMSKKEKKDGENFLLYKGKNGTWITAVTIAGLAIGGASTIGIAQNAFVAGLSAGWYNVAWAFGAIIASFLVVKRFRHSGHNTVTGLVQDLFDKKTGVMMTSLIYFGIIVASIMVFFNQGGWDAAMQMASTSADVPYLSFTDGMGIPAIIAWMVVMCGNTNSIQGVIQIGLTSKDDKSAVNGFRLGALMMIPIGFLCAMLGISSKALIPGVDATLALPMIILSLPPVIAGLTLSALWAADMSTACSMLIGCSTTVSQDIFFKTSMGQRYKDKAFAINKAIILIVGILTYILSSQLGSILNAMKVCLSMAIGTSIVVLGGLCLSKFAGKNAGFWTILVSVLSAGAWLFMPGIQNVFSDVGYLMLLTTGVTFIVVSLFDKNKVSSKNDLTQQKIASN